MTNEQKTLLAITSKNLNRNPQYIIDRMRARGITVSKGRVKQAKSVIYDQPLRFHTCAPPWGFGHKWQDTNPDRIQDHPLFNRMMNKFEQSNKLPSWVR